MRKQGVFIVVAPTLLLKAIYSGPLLIGQNSFANVLVFAKIFDNKVGNLRSPQLREHAILLLGNLPLSIFQNIAVGYGNTLKYFFLLDVPLKFKVSERPPKCVVVDNADM